MSHRTIAGASGIGPLALFFARGSSAHAGRDGVVRHPSFAIGTIVLAILTATPIRAVSHVIPPGQEELVAAMLGRDEERLPGGCRLRGAAIQQTRVTATFDCDPAGSELIVQLRHVNEGGIVRTERFAVTLLAGAPAPEFVDALAERIRHFEGQWKWGESGDEAGLPSGERADGPLGPWRLAAALFFMLIALVRSGRPISRHDLFLVTGTLVAALGVRITFGPWGPLRVNGLAPMWLDGAISDPGQLYGYGPGYPELFSFVAHAARRWPDMAIFAANGVVSSLVPPLAFTLARLFGIDRTRATAAAGLVALDPVAIRMATTESYMPAIIALTALAAVLSTAAARRAQRSGWPRALLLGLAAGFVLSQSVRIHPLAWLPAVLAPLAAFAAGVGLGVRVRVLQALAAWLGASIVVTLSDGRLVFAQLRLVQESEVMTPSGLTIVWWFPVLAGVIALAACRWARPLWPIVPALLYLGTLAATRHDFAQSWIWQQSYARLYLVLPVVAAIAFVRQEWFERRAVRVAAAGAVVAVFVVSLPFLRERTTDHLEYRWVRRALADFSPECMILYVGQVGKRNMMLPIFGAPASPARKALRVDGDNPGNLTDRLRGSPCTFYVRTSLCSSTDARPACDRLESKLELESVAAERFPAVPSNDGMPYDRAQVETAIYRVGRVR